jgi:predicted ATPase
VRKLPSGTVTFLFTDIEGSTRLLQELGEAYAEALDEHRRLLREAFARHNGVEVDTQGDAFFYAFARATDAIAAATEAQDALVAGPVRVRMGLHTGEPQLSEEGYVGIEVHRAARIAAAGHGGQLLVSQTTHELLGVDVELRDLGEHRLKDLSQPERLYQLGEDEFPPLRSLNQTNLPIPVTPLVGRSRELAELLGLLGRDDVRLLTLTGPGGTGKTRLALEAAADAAGDYESGVFWVPLAPLRDPALVLEAIGRALSARRALAEEIGEKSLLILLDNFEQVVGAASALAQLLGSCRNLNLLVTSRQPLHLAGERLYPVPPLAESEAVALFNERAQAVQPEFSANGEVVEICLRLDGLPLAIELAAARVKVLPPRALLERLERRLPLLTGGARDAPERQRTLRATIAWSYELLDEEEQRLFARLAVFSGGFTIEAAEEVCQAELDTLQSLLDKSLLRRRNGRFWMLETIREYALERFDEMSDAGQLRRRHAEHFVALAEQAEPELERADSTRWLELLEAENDNLRAALSWASDAGEADLELRLVIALGVFWYVRGYIREGRERFEAAIVMGSARAANSLRVKLLEGIEVFAGEQGDYERASTLAEERLALCRALGDSAGVARALRGVAAARSDQDRLEEARALYEESLAYSRQLGDKEGTASSTLNLGALALLAGDHTRADALTREALGLFQGLGNQRMVAGAFLNLGSSRLVQRQYAEAAACFRESLRSAEPMANKNAISYCLEGLAAVGAAEGDSADAARLLGAAEVLRETIGAPAGAYEEAIRLNTVAAVRQELGEDWFGAAWAEGRAMTLEQAIELGHAT